MILRNGNMFDKSNRCDILLATTNAYVKGNGMLVMGRGAAYAMTQAYPGSQAEFGRLVIEFQMANGKEPYGILLSTKWVEPQLGIFQVKRFFSDDADLNLIDHSCWALRCLAMANPDLMISLNYPGIGNGRLDKKVVEPLLEMMPNNVEIWTL